MSDKTNKKSLFRRILTPKGAPDSLRLGLRGQRPLLVWSLLLFTLANSAGMATNVMLMRLVDQALAGQFETVSHTLKIILILFLVVIPIDILHIRFSSQYVKASMLGIRQRFLSRLLQLNLRSFNQRGSSSFYSHITNDLNTLETNDIEGRYQLATELIRALTALAVLAYINIRILLLLLLVAVFFLFASNLLGNIMKKHEKERTELFKGYTLYLREILTAFRLVKSNNLEKRSASEFNRKSESVQHKGFVIDKVATLINAFLEFFLFSVIFGSMMLVAYLANQGLVSAGYVILVINSMGSIVQPLSQAMQKIPLMKGADQIWQSIDESLEVIPGQVPETEPFDGLNNCISFNDVGFSYEDTEVLKALNLNFEKGKKYLLLGPSGGGKSTILRLLRKYISPDQGELMIDDVDLDRIISEEYLRQLANVEQHVFLFEDSLRNNLTLYKDYPDEEVEAAIEASGLEDFVLKQPSGLEQLILDNGKNVSGGEKARIAIARGLLRKSDILLLDEAFASLDDEVAKSIEKRLLALEGVTVIQVSHVVFPETIDQYDQVLEIVQGSAQYIS
ncbi:MAG TPA: ABC transporter ATP-binding protein [Oscillospiraceae bacterium]|jgi:ATP-binding cassette subfamily B protein|nr:ABC transporter ATP-binding protein [Oscillospiraceae bacterium]